MSLIPQFRDRWSTKPPPGVNLDQGFPYGNCTLASPLSEGGGLNTRNWANNRALYQIGTLIFGATWTKGKYGPSVTTPGGAPGTHGGGVKFGPYTIATLSAKGVTVLIGCRIISVTNGGLLWGNNQTGTSALFGQMFTDGSFQFSYGDQNFGQGVLRTAQDLTGDNIWCFTAGLGRGMEVWRNGVLTATKAPPAGIDTNSDNFFSDFYLGDLGGTHAEFHFCYVWPYQLSVPAILTLTKNPWIVWLPPDSPGREVPFVGGGGGGPTVPTCSLSASPGSALPGDTITLTWTTTGTPTSASINQGVGAVATGGGATTVPMPATTTTWTLTVTNAGGSSTCSATVFSGHLGTGCNFVVSAQVGVPYSHTFTATSGTPPYTFSISAGTLPFGLTLDPSNGVVSGTPTQSGIFFFTVTATDSNGLAANVQCSMPVGCL